MNKDKQNIKECCAKCDCERCLDFPEPEGRLLTKKDCPYCDINIPLKEHNEELFQWHLKGHTQAPQEEKPSVSEVHESYAKAIKETLSEIMNNPRTFDEPNAVPQKKDTSLEETITEIADCFEGEYSYNRGQIRTIIQQEIQKAREETISSVIEEIETIEMKPLRYDDEECVDKAKLINENLLPAIKEEFINHLKTLLKQKIK